MANADSPFGLRPVGHLLGAPVNGALERVFIPSTDSTDTFIGDAVKSGGSADADGVPTVAQVAAGDAIRGVIVAFEADGDDLSKQYRPASTARYALINSDPFTLFEIQEDADGGALAATDVGNNVDIVVGTGSTVTGLSAMEADSSSKATTAAQLRIIRYVQRADNSIAANGKLIVKINEHELTSTTGV